LRVQERVSRLTQDLGRAEASVDHARAQAEGAHVDAASQARGRPGSLCALSVSLHGLFIFVNFA
jgi:hypothetical protein